MRIAFAISAVDIWAVCQQIVVGDLLNFTAHLKPTAMSQFTITGDVTSDRQVNADDLLVAIDS